jgi:hypothetical protein
MVDQVERRQYLYKRISAGLSRAASEHPEIDWSKSSLQLQVAERTFEDECGRYIAGEVEEANLRPLWQQIVAEHIEASI